LIVLGALQYRWSGEVSEASALRMQAALHSSLLSWRQDLYRELAQAGDAFQFLGAGDSKATLAEAAQRYREARRVAAHPVLVKDVFVFQGGADPSASLLRLNKTRDAFEPVAWPEGFLQLHQWLQRIPHDTVFYVPYPKRAGEPAPPGPPLQEHAHAALRHGPAMVAQDVPALLYPVMFRGKSKAARPGPRAMQVDWFIVQLDRKYLSEHIFPELAERYFGGTGRLAYRVAVISVGRDRQVLYSSDPDFGRRGTTGAELTAYIFGPPFGMVSARAGGFLAPPPPSRDYSARVGTGINQPEWAEARDTGPPGARDKSGHVGIAEEGGTAIASASGVVQRFYSGHYALRAAGISPFLRFEPVPYDGPLSDWEVVVENRGGSLEAIAASIRRRNLALSFGVLLVLAATVGMILIASQRAQRLARLQMEFVTGVSHELRTPLTVISSAADNIADGVVDNPQQVMRYGRAIKSQARQLIQLVEQVLLFSAARDRACRYHLQPVVVEEVVTAALQSTAEQIAASGFTLEKEIAPHLPPVEADAIALTQCVQNLITNAVKYGGEARWLALRAALDGAATGRQEVRISVEDKGAGIAPAELEQIFEPFYRSPSATVAQIHGTGLGLTLARSMAEAMNGRLTVASEPGKGSVFTLHLRVGEAGTSPAEVAQAAAAGSKVP
jgi:signal transduction histidine kinase